ncbi:MAG TPA: hypothetical protein VF584_19185 [Longimicrobium sp.]|jgi:hypothetical protein
MQQEFEIRNPLDAATGVRLFLALRRNTITECEIRGLPPEAAIESTEIGAHGVEVRWTGGLPAGSPLSVVLDVTGEPTSVAQELWRDAEGTLVPMPGPLGGRAGLQLASAGSVHDFQAYAMALFTARCEIVEASPDCRMRKYGKFFCDLDLNTNRALIQSAGLPQIEAARRTAIIRLMERMFGARLDERRLSSPDGPATLGTASEPEDVRLVSRVMLDIYRKHLSTPGGELDPEEVWTAFEMFANGELRVEVQRGFPWNGEPDGGQMFCFAEFAFMAIEMGVDEAEWRLALPSHVAIQRIYAARYRPRNGPYDYGAYKSGNYPHGEHVGPRRKAELRARFRDMPVEELALAARSHLVSTFPDQEPRSPYPP